MIESFLTVALVLRCSISITSRIDPEVVTFRCPLVFVLRSSSEIVLTDTGTLTTSNGKNGEMLDYNRVNIAVSFPLLQRYAPIPHRYG